MVAAQLLCTPQIWRFHGMVAREKKSRDWTWKKSMGNPLGRLRWDQIWTIWPTWRRWTGIRWKLSGVFFPLHHKVILCLGQSQNAYAPTQTSVFLQFHLLHDNLLFWFFPSLARILSQGSVLITAAHISVAAVENPVTMQMRQSFKAG